MARKKVIDLQADKCIGFGDKPGQKKPGQEVSGYYLGSRNVKTEMGPSTLHILQTADGSTLGVWGSAQLNGKLEQIAKGTMVFIVYKKKIKVPRGTMKVFEVEYDDEDTIHVEQTEVNFTSNSDESEAESEELEASDESAEEEAVEEEYVEEEEAAEPEPVRKAAPPVAAKRPAPAASAVSAEARARANALLGAKKR